MILLQPDLTSASQPVKELAPYLTPQVGTPQTYFYGAILVIVIIVAAIFIRLYIKSSEARAEFGGKHLAKLGKIEESTAMTANLLQSVKTGLENLEKRVIANEKEIALMKLKYELEHDENKNKNKNG